MPIHDWTRVFDGVWHDFHLSWVVNIQQALNEGLLPGDYYAMSERQPGSEVLFQKGLEEAVCGDPVAERAAYALKRRTIVIRHVSGDRIVAWLEIVSPGNKSSRNALRSFVEKAVEVLYRGYHLLIVDLFPPGPRDPYGIHAAIWGEFSDDPDHLPPNEPLSRCAYSAGPVKKAYIEPTAVGRDLIDMPLFLTPESYVNVPLEATYRAAYSKVPRRWRVILEAPPEKQEGA